MADAKTWGVLASRSGAACVLGTASVAGTGKKKYLPMKCGGRVRELPNGRFQGQLQLPGNRYQSLGGTFDTGEDAAVEVLRAVADARKMGDPERYLKVRRELTSYRVQLEAVQTEASRKYTLRWWNERWLQDFKKIRKDGLLENQGTYDNYRSMIDNYIDPFLGDYLITEITYDDCYVWLQKLKITPRFDGRTGFVSAHMIIKAHKLLSKLFKDAVRRRQIPGMDRSPLDIGLELPTVVKKRMTYPSIEEFRRILGQAPHWARDLMIFLCFSGLRLGEVLGITYEDVRPNGVLIDKQLRTGSKAKYFTTTKDASERVQPLCTPAYQALQRQLLRYPDDDARPPRVGTLPNASGLVWRSEEGGFLTRSTWSTVWHAAREKAGVPHCRSHDMRRAFGNYLVDQGTDIYVVQLLLGHSNVDTTLIYLGRNPQTLLSAVSRLNEYLPVEMAAAKVAGLVPELALTSS
jgi:integrase